MHERFIIFYLALGSHLNYFNIINNPVRVITCLTAILHWDHFQQGSEKDHLKIFTFQTQQEVYDLFLLPRHLIARNTPPGG